MLARAAIPRDLLLQVGAELMTESYFYELIGGTGEWEGTEDLSFESLLLRIREALNDKMTYPSAGKTAIVLVFGDDGIVLSIDDRPCYLAVTEYDNNYGYDPHPGHFLGQSDTWERTLLESLPRGTIGRWLHPEIEAEFWRLKSPYNAQVKATKDAEWAAAVETAKPALSKN
jgi:hypothetical protein